MLFWHSVGRTGIPTITAAAVAWVTWLSAGLSRIEIRKPRIRRGRHVESGMIRLVSLNNTSPLLLLFASST